MNVTPSGCKCKYLRSKFAKEEIRSGQASAKSITILNTDFAVGILSSE